MLRRYALHAMLRRYALHAMLRRYALHAMLRRYALHAMLRRYALHAMLRRYALHAMLRRYALHAMLRRYTLHAMLRCLGLRPMLYPLCLPMLMPTRAIGTSCRRHGIILSKLKAPLLCQSGKCHVTHYITFQISRPVSRKSASQRANTRKCFLKKNLCSGNFSLRTTYFFIFSSADCSYILLL
jgi:hypothetical protein